MIWTQPKKFLERVVFFITIISGFVSTVAIVTILLWNYDSAYISSMDAKLVKYFEKTSNDLNGLYLISKEMRAEKKYEKALEILYKLSERIKSVKPIYKISFQEKDVMKDIIELEISLGNFNKAKNISLDWISLESKNINAKLKYIEVLQKLNDTDTAEKELDSLYDMLKGEPKISNAYINFLVNHNRYSEALAIRNETRKIENFMNSAKFKLYYVETNEEVISEKKKVNSHQYSLNNKFITVKHDIKLNGLYGMRFDIDYLANFVISEISARFITIDGEVYTTTRFEILRHLKKVSNKYHSTGHDPHFNIVIPSEIRDYSGIIRVEITFKIDKDKEENLLQNTNLI